MFFALHFAVIRRLSVLEFSSGFLYWSKNKNYFTLICSSLENSVCWWCINGGRKREVYSWRRKKIVRGLCGFANCSISIDRSRLSRFGAIIPTVHAVRKTGSSVSWRGIFGCSSAPVWRTSCPFLRPPSSRWNDKFGESQSTTEIRSYQDLSNRLPTWPLCINVFCRPTNRWTWGYLIFRDT